MKRILYIVICYLLFVFSDSFSQTKLTYNIDILGVASDGKYSPFWLSANRYGLSSVKSDWGYLRAAIKGTSLLKGNWRFDYAVDVVGGHNTASNFFMQQFYVDVSWRWLRFSFGKKEREGEFKDIFLSTGSLVESGNASPIPQIRIEIPEYKDFFSTNGWFGLRGHIAYGWFSDGDWQKDWVAYGKRFAKNVLYHSKSVFWKLGKEEVFPLTYEGGVQVSSQFGGTVYNYQNIEGNDVSIPARFKDFIDVFFFRGGSEETPKMEQVNVLGNHVGSYHLSLKYSTDNWSLRGYYEHMFEDHSGMFWEYGLWKDCLLGVELETKRKCLNKIVFEYFNSREQAGPINHDSTDDIPDQISGADQYYNNFTYPCWQQYGMVIGSPLITSCVYNEDKNLIIYNNRVETFHFGFMGGLLDDMNYRILLTKSYNWGTYTNPFIDIQKNVSGLFELAYLPKWAKGFGVSLSFAFDEGELYGNNRGFVLGIRKSGKIF